MKKFLLFTYCLLPTAYLSFSQWNSNPAINTPVCTSTGNQVDPRMMDDNKGGAFIVWKDYRNSVPDIYIQHIDSLGYNLWTPNGVAICTNSSDQSTPAITTDMHGGAIVTWSDWRSGIERDIYAQRIDSNGTVLWVVDGVVVTNKPNREHNEKIVSDDAGGAIIVWEEEVGFGQWDIWAQRIDTNGNLLWGGGIPVCTVNANRLNQKVQSDKRGGAMVTWQDYRNGFNYDIYAQRLSPSGSLMWGGNGIAVCTAAGAQTGPKIDPDSATRGVYISWIDKRNGVDYDIYIQKLDSAGNILWAANGIGVCTFAGNQSAPDILSSTKIGGLIITWKDSRNGPTNYDIYAQKVDAFGNVQWAANGVAVCSASFDQLNPNIVSDGTGGAIIVWQDRRANFWDVYSQKINGNGAVQWTMNGVAVGIASGDQKSPKNVSDGWGGSIYAWQDRRNGMDYDIYVHHLYWNGTMDGINELPENIIDVKCFPNPFSEIATLQIMNLPAGQAGPLITNYELALYDVFGKKVFSANIRNSSSFVIRREGLPDGMYFLQVKDKEKIIGMGKLIIQH